MRDWPARSIIVPCSCPYRKTLSAWPIAANRAMNCLMRDVLKLIWWGLIGLFRSRASLEAEILVLRHQ